MTVNNKLEKSFGPVGSIAGITLFVAGMIAAYNSAFGLIFIVLGAFVGFSTTSTLINFDFRKVKFSNNLFGFIRIGKWLPVTDEMKIGIRESNVTWRAYSRSNRSLDIESHDFMVILLESHDRCRIGHEIVGSG